MPYLNSIQLIGRLTADPELVTKPGKPSVTEFTLAINFKGQNGKEDWAEFYDAEIWGGWAENLARNAKKGDWLYISGRLYQERWTDTATHKEMSRLKIRAKIAWAFVPKFVDNKEENNVCM